MNFSGFHLHMALVIGLICIVIYVFYVSKDIVTIDREVRSLRARIETLQKQTANMALNQVSPSPVPVVNSHASTQVDVPATCEVPVVTGNDKKNDENEDDLESVDSGKIQQLLSHIDEEEHQVAEVSVLEEKVDEDIKSSISPPSTDTLSKDISATELRELCKKNGLANKGTKKQLLDTLKENGIVL